MAMAEEERGQRGSCILRTNRARDFIPVANSGCAPTSSNSSPRLLILIAEYWHSRKMLGAFPCILSDVARQLQRFAHAMEPCA